MPKLPPRTSNGNGEDFVRLKSGESITGIFVGDHFQFTKTWADGKHSTRFQVNLVIKNPDANASDRYVAKIFEFGPKIYDQIYALQAEYNLDDTVVKISREGSGMNDTKYSIIPLKAPKPQGLDKVVLHDLGPSDRVDQSSDPFADVPPPTDEFPF